MRRRDRADERARQLLVSLGREARQARRSAGLSQQAVARAAGVTQSVVSVLERGRGPAGSVRVLSRVLDAVGLDLTARAFPGADPIRDAGQVRALERLRSRIGESWRWSIEEPLPMPGDRRAWDAVIRRAEIEIAIEIETRPMDLQALLRRIALKRRDGHVSRFVLVLTDTRWNRALIRAHEELLASSFRVPGPRAIAAIAAGRDPGGDAILLI